MNINGGTNGPTRPDATRDTVEISNAGGAKPAETTTPHSRSARLQEIRERILRGAYDTDEVVGEVARRILDAGHLQVEQPSGNR